MIYGSSALQFSQFAIFEYSSFNPTSFPRVFQHWNTTEFEKLVAPLVLFAPCEPLI